MNDKAINEAVGHLAENIAKIAHGDNKSPGGLEALAMAISESQKDQSSALDAIANGCKGG